MGIDVVTLAAANAATDEKIKQAAIGGGVDLTDYLKKEEAYTRQEIDDKVENLDYENLKNKPFYSEIVTGINRDIVPLQKIKLSSDGNFPEGCVGTSFQLLAPSPIICDTLYNFTFDDEISQVMCVYIEGNKTDYFVFGNPGLMDIGENTGESYAMVFSNEYYDDSDERTPICTIVYETTAGAHTIGLSYIENAAPLIVEDTYSLRKTYNQKEDYYEWDIDWGNIFGLHPQEGDKYKLTFGNTIYEITPAYYNEDDYVFCISGNLHIMDEEAEDTGEDYVLAIGDDWIEFYPLVEGDYVVSLEKVLQPTTTEIIHKIDSKYLDIDIDVDIPYTKDNEGNVIFENDIYVDGGDTSIRAINEGMDTINESINALQEDVEYIENSLLNSDSSKQLVEGLFGGLSANPDATPTGANAWVEGKAASNIILLRNSSISMSWIASTPYLSVEKITTGKTTETSAKINIPMISGKPIPAFDYISFLSVVFEDSPEQIYYINKTSLSVSATLLTISFSFVNGYDTFPIDTAIKSRYIRTLIAIPFSGDYSHSEGSGIARGHHSHAEGYLTTASGNYSHAEGSDTTASGICSHAEGDNTIASGDYAHAEGYHTTASGNYSHAEGSNTTARGYYSHAEGGSTIASGDYAHAEGSNTTASGICSHAEGGNTTARGYYSHAEGGSTIASGDYVHVQGKYNIEDTKNKYAHIVGNGVNKNSRSNAHTLDWEGNAWYAGTVEATGISMNFIKLGDQLAKGTGDFKENRILGQNILVLGQLYEINIDNLDYFMVTCCKDSDNSDLIIENPNYNFYGSQDDSSGSFSVRLEGDSNEHTITIREVASFKDDLSPYLYSLERKILELETKLNAIIQ